MALTLLLKTQLLHPLPPTAWAHGGPRVCTHDQDYPAPTQLACPSQAGHLGGGPQPGQNSLARDRFSFLSTPSQTKPALRLPGRLASPKSTRQWGQELE